MILLIKRNVNNKTMRRFLMFSFIVSFIYVFPQSNTTYKKNAITLEAFGHSNSLIAINYERVFSSNNEKILYVGRVGYGRTPGDDKERGTSFNGVNSIPVVFSLLYGNEHFVQLGLGYIAVFSQDHLDGDTLYKKYESDFSISLGYRYMSKTGVVAQIYPIFIIRDNSSQRSLFSLGVSLGYAF